MDTKDFYDDEGFVNQDFRLLMNGTEYVVEIFDAEGKGNVYELGVASRYAGDGSYASLMPASWTASGKAEIRRNGELLATEGDFELEYIGPSPIPTKEELMAGLRGLLERSLGDGLFGSLLGLDDDDDELFDEDCGECPACLRNAAKESN